MKAKNLKVGELYRDTATIRNFEMGVNDDEVLVFISETGMDNYFFYSLDYNDTVVIMSSSNGTISFIKPL